MTQEESFPLADVILVDDDISDIVVEDQSIDHENS